MSADHSKIAARIKSGDKAKTKYGLEIIIETVRTDELGQWWVQQKGDDDCGWLIPLQQIVAVNGYRLQP